MKLIASLLITLSLICGSLAASTSYLAPLSLPDDELLGLTLGAPAGLMIEEKDAAGVQSIIRTQQPGETMLAQMEARTPIVPEGAELNAESLAALRAAGVAQVKVQSFSFSRWKHDWIFGLSVIGLLAGAFMLRSASRTALAGASAAGANGRGAVDGRRALEDAREAVAALNTELAATRANSGDVKQRLRLILERLTALQEGPLANFIADRPRLINKMGLAGYAALMDRFAAGERQINRAWSAAADGYLEEAEACVAEAEPLLVEAITRLGPE